MKLLLSTVSLNRNVISPRFRSTLNDISVGGDESGAKFEAEVALVFDTLDTPFSDASDTPFSFMLRKVVLC